MKMKSIKNSALAAPLAVSFAFASVATANAQPEFNAQIDIGNGSKMNVQVDCDLLDKNGDQTIEFLRQFDVFGHLDNENNMSDALWHLRLHGVEHEDIQKAQKICLEHF